MTRFVTTESQAAELLLRLVAIPSIAPGVEDGVGEGAMADAVEAFARERGALVERQEVFSGRSNVICTLPGEPGSPTLIFEAHMDTVALGAHAARTPAVGGRRRIVCMDAARATPRARWPRCCSPLTGWLLRRIDGVR